MNIRTICRRALKGLALGFVTYASAGCAGMPTRSWVDRVKQRQTPAGIDRPKPAIDSAKPADATEDSDERHPSRWRQKLRVRYT